MTLAIRLAYTAAPMRSTENLTTSYAAQAKELARLSSEVPAEIVARQPNDNRWSVLQIVGHIADAELLAAVRLRRIIAQDRANLFGYQQEVWADRLSYQQRKLEKVVVRFTLLREENADLLAGLEADCWNLTGSHNEYGVLSLRQLVEDYADHTAKHLDQIRRTVADLRPVSLER